MASHLTAHKDTKLVTLKELRAFPVPKPTDTWHPIPHADVVKVVEELVQERGWAFARDGSNRFSLAATTNGSKFFGVTDIVIPQISGDSEFGLALGFRQSYNKTVALKVAVGTNVFVCDNMMITGDIMVRREHTVHIDARAVVNQLLDRVPEASKSTSKWFSQLRHVKMGRAEGVDFLANCVEAGALPMVDFMEARSVFLGTTDSPDPAFHPAHMGTLWAAYQSVTLTWKHHSLLRNQNYSASLNEVIKPMLGPAMGLVVGSAAEGK